MKCIKLLYHNQRGFTLVEMMIVLMIISVLLLIAIPNMSSSNEIAQKIGCEATIDLLQAQVGAYQIEKNEMPANLQVLKTENYVERIQCPNGTNLRLNENGKVVIDN